MRVVAVIVLLLRGVMTSKEPNSSDPPLFRSYAHRIQRLGDELPPARVATQYRRPLPAGKSWLIRSATEEGSGRPLDPAQQPTAGGQLNCLVVRRLEA
jgi:hypothetical protein